MLAHYQIIGKEIRFKSIFNYIYGNYLIMKNVTFSVLLLLSTCCSFSQDFPVAKKTPKTFTKHNLSYVDDYTWLENMRSEEVNKWVDAENAATEANFKEIRKEYSSVSKLKEYDFFSSNALATKKGKYFYSSIRRDRNKPASLFYRKRLNDYAIEIINPNKFYPDNNAYISGYYPSRNSRFLAYGINTTGSDRQETRFFAFDNSEPKEEVLTQVNSGLSWNGDRGVFYKKNMNKTPFARDSTFQLFYHRIGQLQSEDELVFDAAKSDNWFSFFVAQNKLFVVENNKEETLRSYYYTDITTEQFRLEKVIEDDASGFKFQYFKNDRIYYSSPDFEWGEVRSFNIKDRKNELVVIPQIYMHLLDDTYFYNDYIICKYKTLGKYYLSIYDSSGNFIRKFDAPNGMNCSVRFLDSETKELFVTFYSYTLPYYNFRLNIENGSANPYFNDFFPPKSTLFPLDYFDTKTITFTSRDGEQVPITIIHKKGIVLDGNNPTLLKAYGGFGSVSGPSYDTGLLYFLEKGGVFAYAEIRGGGEKGLKWHRDGRGLNKMNTFNDFIDAAEFLIKEKYTSPNRLAINGASNGGLVVGVAMTQRPDLFKVAVPEVGLFDMARFEEYTVGKLYLQEYGNPEKQKEYESLLDYSPYHNIKEAVNYPITLIITSENDDRVPPVHSYKFAAKLQNRTAQKNPIFLKTQKNAGHYGKVSVYNARMEEKADFYNFILYYLNQ